MRTLKSLIFALCLAVPPGAHAQSSPELRLPEELDETFRKMMEELKPALDEMFRYMESFKGIDDPRYYELPEVLPNGDIIIRRRPDAPPFQPREPEDDEAPVDDTTKT